MCDQAVRHIFDRWRSLALALLLLTSVAASVVGQDRPARMRLARLNEDDVARREEVESLPRVIDPPPAIRERQRSERLPSNKVANGSRFGSLGIEDDGDAVACRLPALEIDSMRDSEFVEGTIDPRCRIDLAIGQSRIIVFREAPLRVYQPDEAVFGHQIISPTEISLFGLKAGKGTLTFWVDDKKADDGKRVLSYEIVVHEEKHDAVVARNRIGDQYRALEREINSAFPDSRITLRLIGDQLVVRGQAKDALEATHILRIVSQHRLGGRGNAPVLTPDEASPIERRETTATEFGYVEETFRSDGAENAAAQSELTGIVNLLEVPGEQQVMLRVTVAEVNRTALRSIGLNFGIRNDAGTTVFQSLAGNIGSTTGAGGGLANLPVSLDNGQVNLAINALRSLRLARTLAEPNLTALNGHTARFQAGGRFPVPIVGGFTNRGLQGVNFIPFGVQLQFTPYIVDRDRVRLQVGAEVSTRDESLGAAIGGSAGAGGTQVSGLNTRNFNTTVELREGQTLAVAGLIQTNFGAQSDRVPFWGDLPLIGHTGGFNRVSSGEQELVILITPELVSPLKACDTPPLPGDDVFEPTDVEFFLGNRLESRRMKDYRASVRTDYHRIRHGDIHCEDQFLIGAAGPTYGCCRQRQAAGKCAPNARGTMMNVTDDNVPPNAATSARDPNTRRLER